MAGLDSATLRAWLVGRSLARGLPPPIPDRGGFRVDTGSESETCRWVFARATPGLTDLAREIRTPDRLLKFCGSVESLAALLPQHWTVRPTGFFMMATADWPGGRLPAGYTIETDSAVATHVRILGPAGDLAASGWAAETDEAFVYDRIVTAVAHRRRGLGSALMSALRDARRDRATPGLLVATPDGRVLYETLGWRALSPYATASIETV